MKYPMLYYSGRKADRVKRVKVSVALSNSFYSGRKADRVKVLVALSNSFFFLGS